MNFGDLINFSYIAASICFILGIKMLGSQKTARRGNVVAAIGMLIAVVATLLNQGIISYEWIAVGVLVGTLIGVFAARLIAMTAMPELVAIFNGFGGLASLLVAWSIFHGASLAELDWETMLAIYMATFIGGLTFTGSIVAYGKLAGKISTKPVSFWGQHLLNTLLLTVILVGCFFYPMNLFNQAHNFFIITIVVSLLLGILVVIPIGGADMPVVIALLNSYSGIAASASGFVILNDVLIVSGALVGASGLILTNIMCKSMNRSLRNVLFGGFGTIVHKKDDDTEQGTVHPINPADTYLILEAAHSVVIVPGYGMAVAQAQHVVKELGELLEHNDTDVKFAVHPVAGRMPGHMNVLLAEAGVPYELLVSPDDINSIMPSIDACIVIGANDVVNPAARDDKSSPIYGMPIIEVDKAKTTFVLKRSMASGFAGIENPLFFNDNTRMLFGDAKVSVSEVVSEFKS